MNLALELQTPFVVKKKKSLLTNLSPLNMICKEQRFREENQCGASVFLSGPGLYVPEQVECHGEGAL